MYVIRYNVLHVVVCNFLIFNHGILIIFTVYTCIYIAYVSILKNQTMDACIYAWAYNYYTYMYDCIPMKQITYVHAFNYHFHMWIFQCLSIWKCFYFLHFLSLLNCFDNILALLIVFIDYIWMAIIFISIVIPISLSLLFIWLLCIFIFLISLYVHYITE